MGEFVFLLSRRTCFPQLPVTSRLDWWCQSLCEIRTLSFLLIPISLPRAPHILIMSLQFRGQRLHAIPMSQMMGHGTPREIKWLDQGYLEKKVGINLSASSNQFYTQNILSGAWCKRSTPTCYLLLLLSSLLHMCNLMSSHVAILIYTVLIKHEHLAFCSKMFIKLSLWLL